jgi:hypothetical protein
MSKPRSVPASNTSQPRWLPSWSKRRDSLGNWLYLQGIIFTTPLRTDHATRFVYGILDGR